MYLWYSSLSRDLESIERMTKLKKTRTDDSDDEDVDAQEDNYDDDEVSVRKFSILFSGAHSYLSRQRSMKKMKKRWKPSCPINLGDSSGTS